MGAAHIRPLRVDATLTVFIEQRAATFGMRCSVRQKLCVMPPNKGCFRFKYGQIVGATRVASLLALHACSMHKSKPMSDAFDFGVECINRLNSGERDCVIG